MQPVKIENITIGGNELVLIAGPCVIESREHARHMAARLIDIASDAGISFIFKASFDKANRSSLNALRACLKYL